MPTSTLVLLGTLLLLICAGALETWALFKARSRLTIRVHVNGTRGKSSVTRLIAGALREAGIVTFAKTTGTLPRMIFPDGSELPVHRASRANVIEQARTLRIAAATGAKAVIVECMALQPLLQSFSELRIVRATHGVITNARPDHLDVMGPASENVAEALAGSIPKAGLLFTAEREHLRVFERAAKDRKSKLVPTGEQDIDAVHPEELSRFRYTEHAENVALALSVAASLGVEREVALRGMSKVAPDPGALTVHDLDFFGRRVQFYNGFAANDPVSTQRLWQLAIDRAEFPSDTTPRRIAVFNCRADRADRSAQLAKALVRWPEPDWVVLMGTGTHVFARVATNAGIDARRFVFTEGMRVEEIFERLIELSGRAALIMGMGNIGGQGLDLVRLFRNRQKNTSDA